jgi:hypothetical protein
MFRSAGMIMDSDAAAIQKILIALVKIDNRACWVWLVAGAMAAMGASPVDESKPYGRVCIGVVRGEKEEPLQAESKPGADTFIVAHAEANEPCQMLLFALNARDGKLARDWRPQFVDLPQSEEVQLPDTRTVWKWSASTDPVHIYVLFLHPNSKDARELKVLVTAMLNPSVERRLLDRQSVRLRELATRYGTRQGEIVQVVKDKRAEVGGTYRGAFPWRRYASTTNFSEVKAGLLIFVLSD